MAQHIVKMDKTGTRDRGDFRPRRMGDAPLDPLEPTRPVLKSLRMGDEPVEVQPDPKVLSAQASAESWPDEPKRMGDVGPPSTPSETSISPTLRGNPPPPPTPSQLPSPPVPVTAATAAKEPETPAKAGNLPSLPNPKSGNLAPPA